MRLFVQAVKRGQPIVKPKKKIRRKKLAEINEFLLKSNTNESYQNRAVLNLLRSSIGRGGELSTSCWETVFWDPEDELIVMQWSEEKTGKQNLINYGTYANNWDLDVIYSIAAYLATYQGRKTGNNQDDVSWIFPEFTDLSDGGASRKACKILEKCIGHVDDIDKSSVVHGIRGGAADDCASNKNCPLMSLIARGNWNIAGDCTVASYLTYNAHVTKAGRVLAGFNDPDQKVAAPCLKEIENSSDCHKLKLFVDQIFTDGSFDINSFDNLKTIKKVMAASLLDHFSDVIDKYTIANVLVRKMIGIASMNGISTNKLRQWGQIIKTSRAFKNSTNESLINGDMNIYQT